MIGKDTKTTIEMYERNAIYGKEGLKRATKFSAGYDIVCPIDVSIKTDEYTPIDTQIAFDGSERFVLPANIANIDKNEQGRCGIIPACFVGLIAPRSSYGFKYGMRFANTLCVIDQDYRDTIKLSVSADIPFDIKAGDRIGQIIFIPYLTMINEVPPEKERDGGIGSTGV